MKYLSEIKAEDFLEKNGFNVVPRVRVSKKSELSKALIKISYPFVMKISGKKIVHKNYLNGIRLNIKNYTEALKNFLELKKIKGCTEVLIQRKIEGKEFLVGIKYTKDFGHVIAFGAGGIKTEEKKDVSFRVPPLEKKELEHLIKSVKATKGLLKKEGEAIEFFLMQVSDLIEKHPQIKELDINPLMVNGNQAIIVDARILM